MNDFTSKGLPENKKYLKRFCANLEDSVITNLYADSDRKAFSFDITACNSNENRVCATDTQIELVLTQIYMTVYMT